MARKSIGVLLLFALLAVAPNVTSGELSESSLRKTDTLLEVFCKGMEREKAMDEINDVVRCIKNSCSGEDCPRYVLVLLLKLHGFNSVSDPSESAKFCEDPSQRLVQTLYRGLQRIGNEAPTLAHLLRTELIDYAKNCATARAAELQPLLESLNSTVKDRIEKLGEYNLDPEDEIAAPGTYQYLMMEAERAQDPGAKYLRKYNPEEESKLVELCVRYVDAPCTAFLEEAEPVLAKTSWASEMLADAYIESEEEEEDSYQKYRPFLVYVTSYRVCKKAVGDTSATCSAIIDQVRNITTAQ